MKGEANRLKDNEKTSGTSRNLACGGSLKNSMDEGYADWGSCHYRVGLSVPFTVDISKTNTVVTTYLNFHTKQFWTYGQPLKFRSHVTASE